MLVPCSFFGFFLELKAYKASYVLPFVANITSIVNNRFKLQA